jgi:hypothetical protein
MKKTQNFNLHDAKKSKNDEFYTQYEDIEAELRYYREHFYDKVVYCNCDDPLISNFVWYFIQNYKQLRYKKIIATCYKSNDVNLFSSNIEDKAVYWEFEPEKMLAEGRKWPYEKKDIKVRKLKGDGDFRSPECVKLLQEADIVCTNPPFSLFREYVSQLMENNKKLLIIGDQNAITYKEIFKYIKANELWLGVTNFGNKWFGVPEHYEDIKTESRIKWEDGQRYFSKGSICWFTNLDYDKRCKNLDLSTKAYNESRGIVYHKYDNYDALNIDKTSEIPSDYEGVMGVPITFLDKYNPKQFELLGCTASWDETEEMQNIKLEKERRHGAFVEGKEVYKRLLIRNKRPMKSTGGQEVYRYVVEHDEYDGEGISEFQLKYDTFFNFLKNDKIKPSIDITKIDFVGVDKITKKDVIYCEAKRTDTPNERMLAQLILTTLKYNKVGTPKWYSTLDNNNITFWKTDDILNIIVQPFIESMKNKGIPDWKDIIPSDTNSKIFNELCTFIETKTKNAEIAYHDFSFDVNDINNYDMLTDRKEQWEIEERYKNLLDFYKNI